MRFIKANCPTHDYRLALAPAVEIYTVASKLIRLPIQRKSRIHGYYLPTQTLQHINSPLIVRSLIKAEDKSSHHSRGPSSTPNTAPIIIS